MADKNPDKSYGWTSAQNFNDYMEGVIGTDLFSINACLWHHPSCPGAYGEELEKMRFDDEMNSSLDETDYLDFCTLVDYQDQGEGIVMWIKASDDSMEAFFHIAAPELSLSFNCQWIISLLIIIVHLPS